MKVMIQFIALLHCPFAMTAHRSCCITMLIRPVGPSTGSLAWGDSPSSKCWSSECPPCFHWRREHTEMFSTHHRKLEAELWGSRMCCFCHQACTCSVSSRVQNDWNILKETRRASQHSHCCTHMLIYKLQTKKHVRKSSRQVPCLCPGRTLCGFVWWLLHSSPYM